MNLFSKTVDAVISDFNKIVVRLEEVAQHHTNKSYDKAAEAIVLQVQSQAHEAEAGKARLIADKIRALVS